MTGGLDLEWVRGRFPALESGEILMDNAGGAQVPQVVIDRIAAYLRDHNVQHGASYARSAAAGEVVSAARGALARFLNAANPDEGVIGPSTTDRPPRACTAATSHAR